MSKYEQNGSNADSKIGIFIELKPKSVQKQATYRDKRSDFFEHLSTFPGKSSIKKAVLDQISGAKRNIFFTNFLIQDDQVAEALVDAAKRLSGHVYVVTTLKKQDFDAVSLSSAEADDEGLNFQDHIQHISELTRNGIMVKARKDCHAKFMVVDDRDAIITSANAAPTCYTNINRPDNTKRPANVENGVLFSIPCEVARLGNFFRAIWRSAANYYVSPDTKLFDIGEYTKDIIPISCKEPSKPAEKGEVLWTAPEDCRIASRIVSMINHAKERIRIASLHLKGIENHIVGQGLVAAARRGVEVEILVRRMRRPEQLKSCRRLKQTMGNRLKILADRYNHSKAVVIDDQAAMLLTANMDTEHGLDSGVEVAFYSTKRVFVRSILAFLNHLRDNVHLEFVSS